MFIDPRSSLFVLAPESTMMARLRRSVGKTDQASYKDAVSTGLLRFKLNFEMRQRRKSRQPEPDIIPLDPAKARQLVFQRAAKLLAAKQRSVAEMRARLLEGRGATKANVEEVIARLSEYGYLDDAKFAQSYASLRLRERPIGRRRLERDLWLKKIDKQTAEAALDEVFEAKPEDDLIDRAIAKRVRLRGKPKTREDAKKLFDHLLRQGFEVELVSEKVRALLKSEVEPDAE
jgi:regulatory protein